MKILIKRIPHEGETFRGVDPAAIMDLDEPDVRFGRGIEFDLFVQIQGHELLVTGSLATVAILRCGRCLREFEYVIRVRQFVCLQPIEGADTVDLTPRIREDILLEIPQRALCNVNCKGLCPMCGQDRNKQSCDCKPPRGDLRWQALDQINIT